MRTISLLLLASATLPAWAAATPRIHDDRLQLALFAEDPAIVTPIGMAIAPDDRIFVIESHTHLPADDYPGPNGDRIRVFQDQNNNGQPDSNTVFAEGLEAAMNVTITADSRVFVVGARAVWELLDADHDSHSEARRTLLEVKTANTYPHSCLLGITHTADGWLYLGRGNNGSTAYTMQGSDGSVVSGYGDGGNVTRCRFDGSQLEAFATGFWNLFDLEFDQSGRLLGVDNDPDARGPNRLVHIISNGDYGYRSLYGGTGNHPYQGWDGTLPGTLPYISGTGEAPSGLLDARRAALPRDFDDSILVTVWNENTIERHQIREKGTSLTATGSVLVSGSQEFRPVAIDTDSHGNIFITDWVKVDYPNHGKGRIWRISTRPDTATTLPQAYDAARTHTIASQMLDILRTDPSRQEVTTLSTALTSADPFRVQATTTGLAHPDQASLRQQFARHTEAPVRLGALLASKKADPTGSDALIDRFLSDPSPLIRQSALQWIGEHGLAQFADRLTTSLEVSPTPPALFETYLATTALLHPAFITGYRDQAQSKANRLPRPIDPRLIRAAIVNPNLSPQVRALALTHYPHTTEANARHDLIQWLDEGPLDVRRQAIKSLAELSDETLATKFLEIACNPEEPGPLRREALLALETTTLTDLDPILKLTQSTNPDLLIAVLRLLALYGDDPKVKSAVNRAYVIHRNRSDNQALVEQLEDMLYPEPGCCQPRVSFRPTRLEEWQHTLRDGGNATAGEAVFYSVRSGCASCHTIDNRGGKLGPDLSNAGQSGNRQQLIHSILRPSDQFPPQFQAWVVETTDGEEHQGLQLDHKANGAIELFTLLGITERFEGSQIARYFAAPRSLMPNGLEAGLSTSEMRDLIAFLESRR